MKEAEECHLVTSKITKIYTDQMFREKHLIALGTGGGGPGKLRILSVTFQAYQRCDIQEVRSLLIYCVEQYLKIINKHPEIEKHSRNFPYANQNVSIVIIFADNISDNFISPPFIATARADEGKMSYRIYSDKCLNLVHRETYEEALAENGKPPSKHE